MAEQSDSAKWFVAVLVVQGLADGEPESEALLDFQVRVLRAGDLEDAYLRANELGATESVSYLNDEGGRVSWKFIGLHDLDALIDGVPNDGTEVYSWRRRGSSEEAVLPKERLSGFWLEANKHRLAQDLIDGVS